MESIKKLCSCFKDVTVKDVINIIEFIILTFISFVLAGIIILFYLCEMYYLFTDGIILQDANIENLNMDKTVKVSMATTSLTITIVIILSVLYAFGSTIYDIKKDMKIFNCNGKVK